MRIAFLVNKFPVLSQTFILNQITGMIDLGHKVTIFSAKRSKGETTHPQVFEYNLLLNTRYTEALPKNKMIRLLNALRLFATKGIRCPAACIKALNIRRYGIAAISLKLLYDVFSFCDSPAFDVVHAQFGNNGLLAVYLKEFGVLRGPLVTSFHGYDINVLPRMFGGKYYDPLFKKGDLFLANSENTAQKLAALGCPKEKTKILPVGLNVEEFRPKPGKRDNDGLRLVSTGRLVAFKGHEYAIRAMPAIRGKFPGITYSIIGEGPIRGDLENLIQELGLEDSVYLLGAKNKTEVQELLRRADIFLFPSITAEAEEGQGLALQEAQACGVPVVAADSGAVSEGLLDGQSGVLVPQKDAGAIAEAVKKLGADTELRKKMGRKGREFVLEKYDINKLNERLLQLYKQI